MNLADLKERSQTDLEGVLLEVQAFVKKDHPAHYDDILIILGNYYDIDKHVSHFSSVNSAQDKMGTTLSPTHTLSSFRQTALNKIRHALFYFLEDLI